MEQISAVLLGVGVSLVLLGYPIFAAIALIIAAVGYLMPLAR